MQVAIGYWAGRDSMGTQREAGLGITFVEKKTRKEIVVG